MSSSYLSEGVLYELMRGNCSKTIRALGEPARAEMDFINGIQECGIIGPACGASGTLVSVSGYLSGTRVMEHWDFVDWWDIPVVETYGTQVLSGLCAT